MFHRSTDCAEAMDYILWYLEFLVERDWRESKIGKSKLNNADLFHVFMRNEYSSQGN